IEIVTKSTPVKYEMRSYQLDLAKEIHSPGLLIFKEILESNLAEMIRIAGGTEFLYPHCKTHKTKEITRVMLNLGITHHKCATIAEAEMLAICGAPHILIAYQLVGPNIERAIELTHRFPNSQFFTLVDCPQILSQLEAQFTAAQKSIGVFIDLETGMNRTGIEPGDSAIALAEMAYSSETIQFQGLHWYDGHHRQGDFNERKQLTLAAWKNFTRFRDQLTLQGIPIKQIVAAGSGSFPILAEVHEPSLLLSPGTTTLYDADLMEKFPELDFQPAIAILTRVISSNHRNHLTLDVGHKSCAADQPAGKRLWFPHVPDAVEVQQTEEHCVIKTEQADDYPVGSHLIAIPRHACPTVAVHEFAHVVSAGKAIDQWRIAARNRMLTI
ncbi:MAG: D-TA family PLP-dependent enzyme, partial [Planctomycetota bacterium]